MSNLNSLSDRIFRIEEAWELARIATGVGVWDWDMVDGSLFWCSAMHALFGTNPETWPKRYEGFSEQLVPEDLAECERRINECINLRVPYRYQFRLKNGKTIYGLGRCFFSDRGDACRMIGICLECPSTP